MRLMTSLALAALVATAGAPRAMAEARLRFIGVPAETQPVGFDILLKLHDSARLDTLLEDLQRPASPDYHRWLTPAQFAARFGTPPATIARITAELQAAGLAARPNGSHSLHVTGSAGAVARAFATPLAIGRLAGGRDRLMASAAPTPDAARMPALAAAGATLAHFMPAVHMHSHARVASRAGANDLAAPESRDGPAGPYWFDDLKQAYSFPSYAVATGAGAHIGILMSGDRLASDIKGYFSHEKLATPKVVSMPINGGAPFDAALSAETELDIEQSAGMAPGATVTLFNLPDLSDDSVLAGLVHIIEANATDIVNMSFGSSEIEYAASYNGGVDYSGVLVAYDDLFKQGNAQGMTFVASSGDLGAASVPNAACFDTGATSACGHFVVSAENPASSPHVTAVGGTNLLTAQGKTTADLTSTYRAELDYPDRLDSDIFYSTPATGGLWGSGGGISALFAQPSYQAGISTLSRTMRMVPDVALHMGGCPAGATLPCGSNRSAVVAMVGGKVIGLIGTSAAAPDFAGLLALKVQLTKGRLGNANIDIYAKSRAQRSGKGPVVFRNAISGDNGKYVSVHGRYNAVLGVGTPIANAFLGVASKPVAGVPQSASNP